MRTTLASQPDIFCRRNVTKPKRYYRSQALKVLFGLSRNQCAHPDCTNPLIERATAYSDAVVIAHICHIYAFSIAGPRGKPGLTPQELNSPKNLILLCRNHHAIVDGQHETYPAETLQKWKQDHEAPTFLSSLHFPTALVDHEIEKNLNLLRKSRFFAEFDVADFARRFATNVSVGQLAGGSAMMTARALAWCARVLSDKHLQDADNCLSRATALGSFPEVTIAEAFILSRTIDTNAALQHLTNIDLPIARSAAYMILARDNDPQSAADWLKATRTQAAHLDPDGKFSLLAGQLELANLQAARACTDVLTVDDFRTTPALHCLAAMTHLLTTVPPDLHAVVRRHAPSHVAADLPLASVPSAIAARRLARGHFLDAAAAARDLHCPQAANENATYGLWLELRDPDECSRGREHLKSQLRNPKATLHLVPLGLQFGIRLNLENVAQEIDRQFAINGTTTRDAALARFALASTQKTPRAVVDYLDRYHHDLTGHIDQKALEFLRIDMLCRAGMPDKATSALQSLSERGLSDIERRRFERIVLEAKGTNPIGAKVSQFQDTDSISDLTVLVTELEKRESWTELFEYGTLLFERTQSVDDAARLIKALYALRKHEEVLAFLELHRGFLDQSSELKMTYCWSLYHNGRLLDARCALATLHSATDTPHYRQLQLNLYIALGEWESLSGFVMREYSQRGNRDVQDLLAVAQLALHLRLAPHAKELTRAAATKGREDPSVLAAAYFLASNGGWENEPEVVQWLSDAVRLSGDTGPIGTVTFKELMARKPTWDRHESQTWDQLTKASLPLFVAARSLNRSLVGFSLFPALQNSSQIDCRRRTPVLAYSGKRQPTGLPRGGAVGMDATTLLTLGFLELLDRAFDAFESVYLPHSTLSWLFEEKCETALPQPSRLRDARRLEALLATDVVEKFVPVTVGDSDLCAQVGDELALFIAEAVARNRQGHSQHLVVRPSPVHRVFSLMEEEADLTAYAPVLSGCQPVVDALRRRGHLTADEAAKARIYLEFHEKPWPQQTTIADGATLYLDELAVAYFLHLGLLDRISKAGFRAFLSPRALAERRALILHERASERIEETIETVRATISARIESGRVQIGRQVSIGAGDAHRIPEHPTIGVGALVTSCDAILVDDRFVNQNAYMAVGEARVPVFCTLDLLDTLQETGALTSTDRLACRTRLRRAGFFFVPVEHQELVGLLGESDVENGRVVETAELRAIRENLLCVRMSQCLQLPAEGAWLDRVLTAFMRALRDLWRNGEQELSEIHARSDWLMTQIDIRGWIQGFGADGERMLPHARREQTVGLLAPPPDVPFEVKERYLMWIDGRYLKPIKDNDSELYTWVVDRLKRGVVQAIDLGMGEGDHNESA